MTDTIQVKAYSRTTEDDGMTMTMFEYDGSFQANETDIALAFTMKDQTTLKAWSKMMNCFYDALFIRSDNNETVSFNRYANLD